MGRKTLSSGQDCALRMPRQQTFPIWAILATLPGLAGEAGQRTVLIGAVCGLRR